MPVDMAEKRLVVPRADDGTDLALGRQLTPTAPEDRPLSLGHVRQIVGVGPQVARSKPPVEPERPLPPSGTIGPGMDDQERDVAFAPELERGLDEAGPASISYRSAGPVLIAMVEAKGRVEWPASAASSASK